MEDSLSIKNKLTGPKHVNFNMFPLQLFLPLQQTDPAKVHAEGVNMEVVCRAVSNMEKKLQFQLSEQNEKLEKLHIQLSEQNKKLEKLMVLHRRPI